MDLMEQSKRFDQIFAPVKAAGFDAGYERIGPLWQMWVYGPHPSPDYEKISLGGARENGESLAKELADKALGKIAAYAPAPKPVPPQPLTAPLAEKPTPPQTDYDAIIAGLKAQLAEALAKAPEVIEIPAFLQPPEAEMNFHDDFIAREALDGEERADTVARLQLQFEKLTNYSYVRVLEDAEQVRLSELTTNLRLGG